MSKEAEEFYEREKDNISAKFDDNHLKTIVTKFADAYAKHYMKRMLEAKTNEKIQDLCTSNHFHKDKGHYKKRRMDWEIGSKLLRDKLLKELKDES